MDRKHKFFEASDDSKWISSFGCTGLRFSVERKNPEVEINTEGGITKVFPNPVKIDPYKKDDDHNRVIDIELSMPEQDRIDVMNIEKYVILGLQKMVLDSGLKRRLTYPEIDWVSACLWDTFKDED